ncbi:MAG: MarR family transcriptional regulator [Nitrosopumilus sp.]|nr:MarR family transcriptional regulator [Nitrosopumilus sp.]
MDIENSLTFLLTKISTAHQNMLQKIMNEIGLQRGQVFVLISLWKTDGQSQIDLVNHLNLSAPTINKMVGNLIKNGFVECKKCSQDGRMMRVYLTEKSVQIKNSAEEKWIKLETQSFAFLTETEKLILSQLFGKIKNNLDKNIGSLPNDL